VRACVRLGACVATDVSQCPLVLGRNVTMPLREETNEMDLVGLTAVDCVEVVVTIDRIEAGVIGELVFGNCVLGL
jgi:hypothetical protein